MDWVTLALKVLLAILAIVAMFVPIWINRANIKAKAATDADKRQGDEEKKNEQTSNQVAQDAKTVNQSIDAQRAAADELAKKWTGDQTKG